MKLLLLTDCPPCRTVTGGLFLDQLCRFLGPGEVVCFAVTNPELDLTLTEDLVGHIPIEYAEKPSERGEYSTEEGSVPAHEVEARARLIEDDKRLNATPALVERAVAFGKAQGVDAVWAVLEGQTMVRMALPVAQGIGAPLLSLVWDPLSWWLTANRVDAFNAQLALDRFDETLRASASCAAASWAMADDYQRVYGVPCSVLVASHAVDLACEPPTEIHDGPHLTIGMAGQFYASDEWHGFVGALKEVGWRVADRAVRFLVLGHYVPDSGIPDELMDFRGWMKQPDAIRLLAAETDVLYCPYPFSAPMRDVARLSFPSKIPMYFASGRPVVFHGPSYASPARYFERNAAGILCLTPDGSSVVDQLDRLARDPELYEAAAKGGRRAFHADFTLDSLEGSFRTFLAAAQGGAARRAGDAPSLDGADLAAEDEAPEGFGAFQGLAHFQDGAARFRRERDMLAASAAAAQDEKRAALAVADGLRLHVQALERMQEGMRADHERLQAETDRSWRESLDAACQRDHLRARVVMLEQSMREQEAARRQGSRIQRLLLEEKETLDKLARRLLDDRKAMTDRIGALEARSGLPPGAPAGPDA